MSLDNILNPQSEGAKKFMKVMDWLLPYDVQYEREELEKINNNLEKLFNEKKDNLLNLNYSGYKFRSVNNFLSKVKKELDNLDFYTSSLMYTIFSFGFVTLLTFSSPSKSLLSSLLYSGLSLYVYFGQLFIRQKISKLNKRIMESSYEPFILLGEPLELFKIDSFKKKLSDEFKDFLMVTKPYKSIAFIGEETRLLYELTKELNDAMKDKRKRRKLASLGYKWEPKIFSYSQNIEGNLSLVSINQIEDFNLTLIVLGKDYMKKYIEEMREEFPNIFKDNMKLQQIPIKLKVGQKIISIKMNIYNPVRTILEEDDLKIKSVSPLFLDYYTSEMSFDKNNEEDLKRKRNIEARIIKEAKNTIFYL